MTLSARSLCIIMHHIAQTWCPFYIRLWTAILTSISVFQKSPQLKREYNTNPTIFNDKKSKLSPTTLKRRNKNNYTQIFLRSLNAFITKDISTIAHPLYHKQQMLNVNSCSFIQPWKYTTYFWNISLHYKPIYSALTQIMY
jgi:hypothetical protein